MYRTLLTIIAIILFASTTFVWTAFSKTVELHWMINRQASELVFWQEMVDRFEAQNPDIKIKMENVISGFTAKLRTMEAAGVPPDIVRGETDWMHEFALTNSFLDLNPYIERDKNELQLSDFPGPVFDAFTWKGTRFAMPVVMSSLVYNYNTAMYDQAGLSAPKEDWT
ncbi:MAG TPA: extracellular solute-binding protein [Firmicutes bacterium]|nr:extracellular solute-binding protein [Bacillota bacterium]